MFKDNKLRLLMTLAGFERLGLEDELGASWIIPSALIADDLDHLVAVIQGHRENPVLQYGDEDPTPAEEMLRRKPNVRQRAAYDDDDGLASSGDDFEIPTLVGPTNKKDALAELKKKRRRLRPTASDDDEDDDAGGISDATREARRKARLAREREAYLKVKSADFVHASDEETDEEADREFFQREEERRKGQAGKILENMRAGIVNTTSKRKRADTENDMGKRRRSHSPGFFISQDEHDVTMMSEEDDWFARPSTARGKKKTPSVTEDTGSEDDTGVLNKLAPLPRRGPLEDSTDEDEATDTPISSQHGPHEGTKEHTEVDMGHTDIEGRRAKEKPGGDVVMDEESDADIPMMTGARRRGRLVVVDNDDDDDE